ESDRLAAGIEHLHAVLLRVAHAPAAPEIAVDIESETIRRPARLGRDEDALVGELGAAVGHVIDKDLARRCGRVDDVKLRLVGRECEPVRAIVAGGDRRPLPGFRIEAEYESPRLLRRRDVALVIAENAEGRI